MKKYERLFEKEDKQRKEELDHELNANRRRTALDFLTLSYRNKADNKALKIKRVIARNGYDSDDESNYIVEITVSNSSCNSACSSIFHCIYIYIYIYQ